MRISSDNDEVDTCNKKDDVIMRDIPNTCLTISLNDGVDEEEKDW